MDFYVSWSHSDAKFSDYFDYCPMLVSAVPDNKHALKRLSTFPNKLIIDSGAIYYSKNQSTKKLKEIMDTQMYLIDSIPDTIPIKIVHLDEPLLYKHSLSEKYESVEKTLFNALEHMKLFNTIKLSKKVSMIGVIQGYDFPSIQYAVFELKKMGYTKFGLGSLLNKTPKEQIKYISYVTNLVGPENLHIFGVTGIEQIKHMSKLKISSFDSSRPTMAAAFFQVFYSNPFRTYVISSSKVNRSNRLETPLECNCPICSVDPQEVFNTSHRKYMKKRSIHNYYHLVKTIEEIKGNEVKEILL